MKVVLQRVKRAEVLVAADVIGSIGYGILLFLGVEKGDTTADAQWLVDKVLNLRIFPDEQGKMNKSVVDVAGAVLVVSQFTLAASCTKGRRPSFDRAEDPGIAQQLYTFFIECLRQRGVVVASGTFQADMLVSLINDGPVTFVVDSASRR